MPLSTVPEHSVPKEIQAGADKNLGDNRSVGSKVSNLSKVSNHSKGSVSDFSFLSHHHEGVDIATIIFGENHNVSIKQVEDSYEFKHILSVTTCEELPTLQQTIMEMERDPTNSIILSLPPSKINERHTVWGARSYQAKRQLGVFEEDMKMFMGRLQQVTNAEREAKKKKEQADNYYNHCRSNLENQQELMKDVEKKIRCERLADKQFQLMFEMKQHVNGMAGWKDTAVEDVQKALNLRSLEAIKQLTREGILSVLNTLKSMKYTENETFRNLWETPPQDYSIAEWKSLYGDDAQIHTFKAPKRDLQIRLANYLLVDATELKEGSKKILSSATEEDIERQMEKEKIEFDQQWKLRCLEFQYAKEKARLRNTETRVREAREGRGHSDSDN